MEMFDNIPISINNNLIIDINKDFLNVVVI